MITDTLKVFAASLAIFLSGYFTGTIFPKGVIYYTIGNPLLSQQKEVIEQLTDGAVVLINCKDFKRRYPKEYKKLWKILDNPVGIAYQPTLPENDVIAYAGLFGAQITVTPIFFALTPRQRVVTLGHELLHLAGLPDHKRKLDRTKDPIYQQTVRCFPFDSVEF